MTRQTEAPLDDSSVRDNADEDIEYVSKSQLKRDSKALQDLGKQMSHYNADLLARIPLSDELRDAIALAQRLGNKRGALKRHYQFIGKLLRKTDVDPIIDAVNAIEQRHEHGKRLFHQLENWRDRILEEGDPAINACCETYPGCDRQQLRQLWRNHRQAGENKQPAIARQLFRELQSSFNQD